MNIPTTIKTDERIFKITTFDNEIFLANLGIAFEYLKQNNISFVEL